MLEKPDLDDSKIVACLRDEYGLHVVQVAFLPLGADRNTAVYRAVTGDEQAYFVKLRRGIFSEIAVALPRFLSDEGISHVIAPHATTTQQLWASLDDFKLVLYPFVEGRNGFQVDLSDCHWRDLGTTLKRIHNTAVPPAIARRIQREAYSAHWRDTLRAFLEHVARETYDDPVAGDLARFLRARRNQILDLIGRTERLAPPLQAQSHAFVLCHSDIHVGNVLIDADGAMYIVDWDDPIMAPKERDLMFIGGGLGGGGHTPQEEESLFYQGYGQTQIDRITLAYCRYERIVEDIAVFCDRILLGDEGREDREQSLRYLMSNFLPNSRLEIAYKTEETLKDVQATGRIWRTALATLRGSGRATGQPVPRDALRPGFPSCHHRRREADRAGDDWREFRNYAWNVGVREELAAPWRQSGQQPFPRQVQGLAVPAGPDATSGDRADGW